MSTEAKTTTNHAVIRKWVEERDGMPASTIPTRVIKEQPGALRILFPESDRESVELLSWDDFFERFDQAHLAFVYQEEERGEQSRFFKFISRNGE